MGSYVLRPLVLAAGLALATSAYAQSGTIGSGGSSAAGGTSATTLGTGGSSVGADGSVGSSIGSGGSAAAVDGKAQSRTKLHANPNNLMGQSKAQAHDGGTFSKSQTKTQVKPGDELRTRTKTMAHEPRSKPVKSTTRNSVELGQ
ncbi:hypothetical protein ACFQU1_22600 [Chelatococcus sp. GCM10030263]|uniref:hypothetical protein n=1 Tax=Chelatococcus sp. GCM10030263 TaxID=3273387 RepID=UPI003612ABB6